MGLFLKHPQVNIVSYPVLQTKIFLQDEEILDGEDTMKDLRTTFAGIFGEKK